MQLHDPHSQSPGVLNHPNTAEWMEFLYGELAPKRRRELQSHLAQCASCAAQVKQWRASMTALDEWALPAVRRARREWQPVWMLKWAVAAALVLGVGFALGRQTSPVTDEVTALKSTVARLAENLEQVRGVNASDAVAVAKATASAEALRLLADYARLNEARRAEDQQATVVAMRTFESRLARLRAELETVAVNTADGFQQTKAGLTQLASMATPESVNPSRIP